jgi:hypothetical protein
MPEPEFMQIFRDEEGRRVALATEEQIRLDQAREERETRTTPAAQFAARVLTEAQVPFTFSAENVKVHSEDGDTDTGFSGWLLEPDYKQTGGTDKDKFDLVLSGGGELFSAWYEAKKYEYDRVPRRDGTDLFFYFNYELSGMFPYYRYGSTRHEGAIHRGADFERWAQKRLGGYILDHGIELG